jgi:hypothetical protein
MSLLNYLRFQEIDSSGDDMFDTHRPEDDISLDDQFDEKALEDFWDKVVKDIHNDPDWFSFADE